MTEWIEVNGATIERTFLEQNVAEARGYQWAHRQTMANRHDHCMVCNVTISSDSMEAYESAGGVLCSHCHARFVLEPPPDSN